MMISPVHIDLVAERRAVPWQARVQVEGPASENIDVLSSHSGPGNHPAVMWAVVGRLAQPPGEWKPWWLAAHFVGDNPRVVLVAPLSAIAFHPGRYHG